MMAQMWAACSAWNAHPGRSSITWCSLASSACKLMVTHQVNNSTASESVVFKADKTWLWTLSPRLGEELRFLGLATLRRLECSINSEPGQI